MAADGDPADSRVSWAEYWSCRYTLLRGAVIGTLLGAPPKPYRMPPALACRARPCRTRDIRLGNVVEIDEIRVTCCENPHCRAAHQFGVERPCPADLTRPTGQSCSRAIPDIAGRSKIWPREPTFSGRTRSTRVPNNWWRSTFRPSRKLPPKTWLNTRMGTLTFGKARIRQRQTANASVTRVALHMIRNHRLERQSNGTVGSRNNVIVVHQIILQDTYDDLVAKSQFTFGLDFTHFRIG